MSQFERLSSEYIKSLSSTIRSEGFSEQQTPELSFRPNLDKFFRDISNAISPDIEIIFEPKMQKRAGRPDWRFHSKSHMGIFGYVEAKALDLQRPINIPDYEQQVRKYISLGHKVILTDGIEFVFFSPEVGSFEIMSIVEKPIAANSLITKTIDPRLENKFREFFQEASFRKCSEEELVQAVAKRAIQLSASVQELVVIPEGAGFTDVENKTIKILHNLYKVVAEHHDSRLSSPKAFGDFVSQVLSFGLLYAHRIIRDSVDDPNEKRKALEKFWYDDFFAKFSNELGPFKELSTFLKDELGYLGYLGTWYQDSLLFLSYIELDKSQIHAPDYHILFERFLEKFDPETKFDFGAFYTPSVLADYAVSFSNSVIGKNLNSNLFDSKNKIIDPCCGTGTFLESLLNFKGSENLPSLIGFEILPGPYALAQYRVRTIIQSDEIRSKIRILLTNTLSDQVNSVEAEEADEVDLFTGERRMARDLSSPPITLVIGNPPSSDSESNDSINETIIESILEDFRPPPEQRTGRQNTQKQISNPFVKFLRWSVSKVMDSKLGAISLVIPSSFLENASYKWARKYLVNNFSTIYVLDIDSDLRAVDAENIFNVQQGRCLLTAVYKENSEPSSIYYKSITSLSRTQKIQVLEADKAEINLDDFKQVDLDSDWSFVWRNNSSDASYETHFWSIYDHENSIFSRDCNGLKLSPTAFFIHTKKEILKRRLIEFSNMTTSTVEAGVIKWFKGQAKPPRKDKFNSDVLSAIPKLVNQIETRIKNYSHRPFVNLFAYIDEEIMKKLANTDGGGARFRPEIVSAFSRPQNFALAIAPAPKELGESLHQFVSFCWGIPDNDLCSRGNAKIFSLYFPEYKKPRQNWNPTPVQNINSALIEKIRAAGIQCKNDGEELFFYTYAILCSDLYLSKFKDFLFRTSGKSPRIPITTNSELFAKVVNSGKQLAEFEKVKTQTEDDLRSDFKVNFTAFKFSSYKYFSETKEFKLFDQDKVAQITISDLCSELVSMSISGYEVLATWCKFNSYPYTRTEFNSSNLAELGSLIVNLTKYRAEKSALDQVVGEILHSGELLSP